MNNKIPFVNKTKHLIHYKNLVDFSLKLKFCGKFAFAGLFLMKDFYCQQANWLSWFRVQSRDEIDALHARYSAQGGPSFLSVLVRRIRPRSILSVPLWLAESLTACVGESGMVTRRMIGATRVFAHSAGAMPPVSSQELVERRPLRTIIPTYAGLDLLRAHGSVDGSAAELGERQFPSQELSLRRPAVGVIGWWAVFQP